MEPLLKKDQKILLTIKRIGINGEGIGYYKRQAVFVDGVIPPEEVIVNITEVNRNYSKGEVVKFNIRAQKRVKPFCKHFGECGGCQLQHIDYEEQLAFKEEMLLQAVERYAGIDLNTIKVNEIIGMNNPKYYRYKAQMPIKNTDYGLTSGLYKAGTNDIVEILDCPVHNEKINVIMPKILEILDNHNIFAFDPKTMRGLLRYVVTRVSHATEQMQVTLVITIFNRALKEAAKEIIKLPGVESVGISKNHDAKNVAIFGDDEVEILEGKPSILEGIGDIKYDLKPKAFYQLNPEQAIKLYKEVKSHLDFEKERVIVDAYSGSGAIAIYLAPYVDKVLGIDINKESIYSARHNKKLNNQNNIDFEIGEVKNILPAFYRKGFKPDVLIIDPPRSGIDQDTLNVFMKNPINKIIYISCNPSTLAKNLKVLKTKYNVKSITPLDMFPQTSQIESITILEKK
jgi:23S rRNA (uracil-5-)-methyltransferase RumA